MAYYLTIKKNKEYSKLDISNLSEFRKMSKFRGNTSYSLEEIDYFTSCFSNEFVLKKVLLQEGIIEESDITKDIEIRYKDKDKLSKVRYDLVYREASKYFDVNYLRNFILGKSNDKDFLIKLTSFYRNSYRNNENICRIRYILNTKDEHEFTMHQTLTDFVINEIYAIDYKTGNCSLKYKSLHDLAMFCYTYDLNSVRKERNISEDELEENRMKVLNSLKTPKPKVKILEKKNSEIEGQMSFDDLEY